jgi:hypothetical protein
MPLFVVDGLAAVMLPVVPLATVVYRRLYQTRRRLELLPFTAIYGGVLLVVVAPIVAFEV